MNTIHFSYIHIKEFQYKSKEFLYFYIFLHLPISLQSSFSYLQLYYFIILAIVLGNKTHNLVSPSPPPSSSLSLSLFGVQAHHQIIGLVLGCFLELYKSNKYLHEKRFYDLKTMIMCISSSRFILSLKKKNYTLDHILILYFA